MGAFSHKFYTGKTEEINVTYLGRAVKVGQSEEGGKKGDGEHACCADIELES